MTTVKSLIYGNVYVAYVIDCKRRGIAFAIYLIQRLMESYHLYKAKRDITAAIKKREGVHVFCFTGLDSKGLDGKVRFSKASTIAWTMGGARPHAVTFHVDELLKTKTPKVLIASYLNQLKPVFNYKTLVYEIREGWIWLYPYSSASPEIREMLEPLFSKGSFTYEGFFHGVPAEVTYKLKGVICIQSVEGDFFSCKRIVQNMLRAPGADH